MMDTRRPRVRLGIGSLLVAATVAVNLVAACTSASEAPSDGRLQVVTTTTVFADLVRQVGGERVTVRSIVPPGGVVETFDPTPSDLRTVSDADVIVMNGLGLDAWLAPVLQDAGATAPLVVLAEDLDGVTYQAGDGADEPANPHLWLDVSYAMKYVERIVDALIEADPTNADRYQSQGNAYLARLAVLHQETRDRILRIPESDRLIVSFHEAFPYFAAAYGLRIVGTIVDAPGQDPSAGEIAGLVDAIRASGAKAVFGEAQFNPDLVQTVASEANVVFETDLYNDSLGDPPVDTYEGLIQWDADRVVEALGG